jgi:proton glutamate symport protein
MKLTSSSRILIGLCLGLVFGIIYSISNTEFLPSLPAYIAPIGSLWVNAIRMVVIPLLMSLLITAIAGQSNGKVVAQLGGKTIGLFVSFILCSSLFALILAPPLISQLDIDPVASAALLQSTGFESTSSAALPPFSDWLVSLIPSNPFAAAVDGAILPLLIFTGLFAVALLRIEAKQRQTIVEFFSAIKAAMFVLIAWIMMLAPIGIFALVFPLAATLGLSAVTVLGSFVAIVCTLLTLYMLLLYPLIAALTNISIRQFARAVAPVQAIGFSTRSSLAALPATFAATGVLGISEKVSGIVLPIAVTLFKFASPLARTAGTYFIAHLYGIELSPIELFIIALSIGLLSFYSPGIPSGGLLIMAPVYISLGLPVEGIGILIAIDLIVDMFLTMANVTANVASSALIAKFK